MLGKKGENGWVKHERGEDVGWGEDISQTKGGEEINMGVWLNEKVEKRRETERRRKWTDDSYHFPSCAKLSNRGILGKAKC